MVCVDESRLGQSGVAVNETTRDRGRTCRGEKATLILNESGSEIYYDNFVVDHASGSVSVDAPYPPYLRPE